MATDRDTLMPMCNNANKQDQQATRAGEEAGAQPSEHPAGVFVVDKPLGWSSMDVIRRVRPTVRAGLADGGVLPNGRKRKIKAGHAGTLDPLATGVVIVCVGKATKLVERLMGLRKEYDAEINLSAFTATDDAEGERQPVACEALSRESIEEALHAMTGEIEQVPPQFSAVHVGGRRAYDLARQGESVEIQPKRVVIYRMEILAYDWPMLSLRVMCGRGTYIRSIARDLGKALGCGGYLAALRRTRVGPFSVEGAFDEARLQQPIRQADMVSLDELEAKLNET